jgi:hypothetical protein
MPVATVVKPGLLKTTPNSDSPNAIDGQRNPVTLALGEVVAEVPDPHTGRQSTPPGALPTWTHIRRINSPVHGWFPTASLALTASSFNGAVMDADHLLIIEALSSATGVVVHTGPGIGFPANGQVLAPGTACTFDAWTLGSAHLDPTYSTQHYDDRWFRIAGTTTWVPSATITGAPGAGSVQLPSQPHKQVLHTLLNAVNIPDPGGNFPGQCVSFVKQFTHAFGVDMQILGGNGGALHAYTEWDVPGHSLTAAQAARMPFTGPERPHEGDIVVFDATDFNPYGHIGVVQAVIGGSQFILEQSNYNDGAPSNTSVTCSTIDLALHPSLEGLGAVLGWLRLTHLEGAATL